MERVMDGPAGGRPARSPAEVDGPDGPPARLGDDERAAWRSVVEIMCSLPRVLDQHLQADADLTFFEYMVLSVLSERADRTMQMSDLAAGVSASLSRLSHVVAKLERRGLLGRDRIPGAGRRTSATLTDAGYAQVIAAAPGHLATVRALFLDAAEPADLEVLTRIGADLALRIDPDRRPIHDPLPGVDPA
jgi:DNA-binding MarR family transcriptional regulator